MPRVSDIREYKRGLRERCKAERASLDAEDKRRLDRSIARRFLSSRDYNGTDTLLIYVSKGIEIDTHTVIRQALHDGKRLYVPHCRDGANMDFYRIMSENELAPGAFGVLEPTPDGSAAFDEYDAGLCVVPALCFDKAGYRLGFGKGYYDRFLSRYRGKTAGFAYSFQLKDSLRRGRYDRPADVIFTDSEVISCEK